MFERSLLICSCRFAWCGSAFSHTLASILRMQRVDGASTHNKMCGTVWPKIDYEDSRQNHNSTGCHHIRPAPRKRKEDTTKGMQKRCDRHWRSFIVRHSAVSPCLSHGICCGISRAFSSVSIDVSGSSIRFCFVSFVYLWAVFVLSSSHRIHSISD